jgi:peptidoglycan/LPS O-acetylase OafA/YrhL
MGSDETTPPDAVTVVAREARSWASPLPPSIARRQASGEPVAPPVQRGGSLGATLDAAAGRPSGFDYLRITLAVSVVAWHTVAALHGKGAETAFWTGPFRPLIYAILPMFFALSGFLVAGSLERNDIVSFLTLRGMRIFPALAGEVVISALIIGPLLTVLPLADYFSNPLLYQYFLNITGWIHYYLPGVFLHMPGTTRVNIQLWTVPYEEQAYVLIAALALLTVHRRPRLFFTAIFAIMLLFVGREFARHTVTFDAGPNGRMLFLAFLFGTSLYLLRKKTPHSPWLFALAAAAAWTALSFPQTTYLAMLPMAYVTVYLGLLNPGKIFLVRGADYSYGIYLYGFPMQQVVAQLFPGLRVGWFHFPVSLAATCVCAVLSWRLLESRVMAQKPRVTQAIAAMRARIGRGAAPRPAAGLPMYAARGEAAVSLELQAAEGLEDQYDVGQDADDDRGGQRALPVIAGVVGDGAADGGR